MAKILIVDDAPSVLKLLETSLTLEGHKVVKANNAEEGMEKIKAESFEIGIFDVNMPGKSGIELTKIALEMDNGKNMKIVILTSESSEDMKKLGRAAGAKGWLVKPFKDEDLMGILERLV